MGAKWNEYFINLRCNFLMLPDCLRLKKTKNVCCVFWLPCLPCENDKNQSNIK